MVCQAFRRAARDPRAGRALVWQMRVAGGLRIGALLAVAQNAPIDQMAFMSEESGRDDPGPAEAWFTAFDAAGHNLIASAIDRDFAPMLLRSGASEAVEEIEFRGYNATVLATCTDQSFDAHADDPHLPQRRDCCRCGPQLPGAARAVVVHVLDNLLGSGVKWPRLRSVKIGPIKGRAGLFPTKYGFCSCACAYENKYRSWQVIYNALLVCLLADKILFSAITSPPSESWCVMIRGRLLKASPH